MTEPRPCSPAEAVQRALSIIGKGGQYVLGTGDYRPRYAAGRLIDVPWTDRAGEVGSDCAGFAISWCYKLQRHRVGYNRGPWSSVCDDINCNSALEDAQHARDLFCLVEQQDDNRPRVGDLLMYPTFHLAGHPQPLIGHVCIVTSVSHVVTWDPAKPRWDLLEVAQCHGPNGFTPGVVATDGSIWSHHDAMWPKPEHRSHLIRAVP